MADVEVDVEVGLMAFFDDLAWTGTSTPPDLFDVITANRGVIRIRRIGGGGDRDNDFPTVSIQVMAAETDQTPRASFDLYQQVSGRFIEVLNGVLTGWVAPGVCFVNPSKTSGPVELPYPDERITVLESIWRLEVSN